MLRSRAFSSHIEQSQEADHESMIFPAQLPRDEKSMYNHGDSHYQRGSRGSWWKKGLYAGIALTIFYLLYRGTASSSISSTFTSSSGSKTKDAPQFLANNEFDGLTDQQCMETFPDLYYEVERGVAYWTDRGHVIDSNDTDISWRKWDEKPMGSGSGGAMRILIHENELRILESEGTIGHWGYRGRAMGFLYLLNRAIDSASSAGEMLPTVEVAVIFEDIVDMPEGEDGTNTFWTWTSHIDDRTHDRHWLVPNYDLWYGEPMGSFREARRRAAYRDAPFTEKIPKAVWRGSGFLNPAIRNRLVEMSKGKSWSDIKVADWGGEDSDYFISIEDMCKYAMVIHTEGVSYSGRLSYLQNCDSLIFFHDLEWRTFSTHLLDPEGPGQNYVKVSRGWDELDKEITYYLENPGEAQEIINNSIATFRERYMTRPAISCYLRQLINGYATVAVTPRVDRKRRKGQMGRYRRGISFEHFLDKPQDGNFETREWL